MTIKTIAAIAALTILAPLPAEAQRSGQGVPRGSYDQSCSNASFSQGRLYAQCLDTRGQRRGTSLETGRCVGDIANDNGLLVCEGFRGRYESGNDGGGNGGNNNGGGWGGNNGGGNNGGGWGGNNGGNNNGGGWGGNNGGGNNGGWNSGRASITVYSDRDYRGQSRTFDREIANLRGNPLNDQISSMEMRGIWEACSDAYFQGTCETFQDSIRNLNSTSINDRISSLRPIGRRW